MEFLTAVEKLANIEWSKKNFTKEVRQLVKNKSIVLIAVCGETGSGKTTFANNLNQLIPNLTILNADNYFKDMTNLFKKYGSFTALVESGFETDAPNNFQMQKLKQDIIQLKNGQKVLTPYHDMPTGKVTENANPCYPNKFIVVESMCTLFEEVKDLFDIKIYIEIDKQIQFERYKKRASERGHNPSKIEKQFQMLLESAEKYIIPNKKFSDLIIRLKNTSSK